MDRTYVLIGGSRGIGQAVAQQLVANGDKVLSVSRSESKHGTWVQADVTTDAGVDHIKNQLGDTPLDALLIIAGVWEENAFTENYDFLASGRDEIRKIIDVNLVAPIILAHALAMNLSQASNPIVLLMGSTSGLDNYASCEVAYTASKFGLRGVRQSLEIALQPLDISVSIINLGDVATPEVLEDQKLDDKSSNAPIPLAEVVRSVQFILNTSEDCIPSEINLIEKCKHIVKK